MKGGEESRREGGVGFEEEEQDLDFYVENDLVIYVPQEAYELQNQIMAYFMNVHQCGRQRSKQGDGYMMSPAEERMRAKYYWHGIGADFDQAIAAIKQTEGETTKLTFFRGPTAFLYGPTAPSPAFSRPAMV